jgi:hypothetical protein
MVGEVVHLGLPGTRSRSFGQLPTTERAFVPFRTSLRRVLRVQKLERKGL